MTDRYTEGWRACREATEAKAREYAGHYQPHSDGRNTFVLLADWIAALPDPAPAAEPDPAADATATLARWCFDNGYDVFTWRGTFPTPDGPERREIICRMERTTERQQPAPAAEAEVARLRGAAWDYIAEWAKATVAVIEAEERARLAEEKLVAIRAALAPATPETAQPARFRLRVKETPPPLPID